MSKKAKLLATSVAATALLVSAAQAAPKPKKFTTTTTVHIVTKDDQGHVYANRNFTDTRSVVANVKGMPEASFSASSFFGVCSGSGGFCHF